MYFYIIAHRLKSVIEKNGHLARFWVFYLGAFFAG